MSLGYKELMEFRNLEQSAANLGLEVRPCHHTKYLSLVNVDNSLPAYRGETEVCMGNVDELRGFLNGWQASIMYLQALEITNREKIRTAERILLEKKTFGKLADK